MQKLILTYIESGPIPGCRAVRRKRAEDGHVQDQPRQQGRRGGGGSLREEEEDWSQDCLKYMISLFKRKMN